MENVTLDEYLDALEKMKKSRRDRIAVLAQWGVTVIGTTTGGVLAAIAGATTVTLGGITVVLAPTPVGWVVGAAVATGLAAYGLSKMVHSGGKVDTLKDLTICELERRIARLRSEATQTRRREPKMTRMITSLQLLVANGHMTQENATTFIAAIEKKHLGLDEAFEQIQRLVDEKTATQMS